MDLKELKKAKENILKPEDTFQFECAMCGACCRKRTEPIVITGYDAFRAAHALDIPLDELVFNNTLGYLGKNSHVPVLILKERPDGSCRLLRNGRCMVQKEKPVVCALFPLGRLFDSTKGEYQYFLNQNPCPPNKATEKVWTLNQWLDEFGIRETEKESIAWTNLIYGITVRTCKLKEKDVDEAAFVALLHIMYLDYDIHRPYVEQVEENMEKAKKFFRQKFNLKLTF